MAVLLITHDLGVVANMADEVVVIYHGQLMEAGNGRRYLQQAGHDYLKALLKAVPHFDMTAGERLMPLREVEYEIGPLLGKAAQQRATAAPLLDPSRPDQDLFHAEGLVLRRPRRNPWSRRCDGRL